ncbi:MAG: hypothetical protein ACJAR9_000105 [Celeribacter sp.]
MAFYGSATGTSSAICTKCELLGKKNSRMQLARKRRP